MMARASARGACALRSLKIPFQQIQVLLVPVVKQLFHARFNQPHRPELRNEPVGLQTFSWRVLEHNSHAPLRAGSFSLSVKGLAIGHSDVGRERT